MKIKILLIDDSNRTFEPSYKGLESLYYGWEVGFDIVKVKSDDEAILELPKHKIDVIITLESTDREVYIKYPNLYNVMSSSLYLKWKNIHCYKDMDNRQLADEIVSTFSFNASNRFNDYFSIITPVYHTRRDVFERTYNSLKNQKLNLWEWIIIDDSKDKSKTEYIKSFADKDYRIKYYNFEHSGNIGEVKRRGFSLATGKYLLELDHDDVLLPTALERAKITFDRFPDVGFVYSNCAEIEINKNKDVVGFRNYSSDENGNPSKGYWGFSKTGTAEDFEWDGVKVLSNVCPDINSQTVRHITSMPNHFRCWKSEDYFRMGRHSKDMHIADDYELMVRTFLYTRMCHINSTEYVQFYEVDGNQNTQYARNGEIQRLTSIISKSYDSQIHNRFLELGIEDYSWNDIKSFSYFWGDFGKIDSSKRANYQIMF